MAQNNLGATLAKLGQKESNAARLYEAAEMFRTALQGYSREHYPIRWADVQGHLGHVLQSIGILENDISKLEQAIALYDAALELLDKEEISPASARILGSRGFCLLRVTTSTKNLGAAREASGQLSTAYDFYKGKNQVLAESYHQSLLMANALVERLSASETSFSANSS
jgi:tetratricopeptide (TPR) repeat protein